MKKRTIRYALVLCIAATLAGCGNQPKEELKESITVEQNVTENENENEIEVSVEENEIEVSIEEKEDTSISETETSTSTEVTVPEESDTTQETDHFEKFIITSEEDIIEAPGFTAKDFYSEFLGNAGISNGWYYYYTDSLESGKVGTKYQCHEGNYAITTLFYITNTTDQEILLSDHLSAKYVTKSGEYIPLIFYQNPDQVDHDGYPINTTVTVPITPGEERHIQFTTDIPYEECDAIEGTLYIYYDDVEIINVILDDLMVEAI